MDQNSNITENNKESQNYDDENKEEYEKCLRDNHSNGFYNETRPHSQTHCLITTVPQNIANLNIAGKHAPTRQSLRHSRMIVMNKTRRVPVDYLPAIARNHNIAKIIMRILFLIGTGMCTLSAWLLIWTPSIKAETNPFYCSIPISASGILGLIHVHCCRKEYPGVKRNFCENSIKIMSISTSLISTVMSILYILYGVFHLISFSYLVCAPPNFLNDSCLCRLQDETLENSWLNSSYHYLDLTCSEVSNLLNVTIIFSCLINILNISLQVFYLNLHRKNRIEIRSFKKYRSIG